MTWNHNVHYHDVVLNAVPAGCRRALDVGCGRGELAQKLARRCNEVVAIDLDHQALAFARAAPGGEPNVVFMQGDFLEQPLLEGSFDFVVSVATLHHLPLRAALGCVNTNRQSVILLRNGDHRGAISPH